jgi:transposase
LHGRIAALPLFLRIPERIKGLMLLLTIALQVLTMMEFVSRKELSKRDETISGLVPGNPKMKTRRPTSERLL